MPSNVAPFYPLGPGLGKRAAMLFLRKATAKRGHREADCVAMG
jgi:hypothetical protein